MAQTATNPKIEELRSRLKSDPKSRLFFPLAEELRKAGNCAEAEQVLRNGLSLYPTYLGAWVSLGRVLRDLHNDGAAVEALTKALQLDPGNVVAARLLADAHLALGDRVEAIKKYKLVQALLPGDDEVAAIVEQIDRDLHPPTVSAAEESPAPYETSAQHDEGLMSAASEAATQTAGNADEMLFASEPAREETESDSPFALDAEPTPETSPEPAAESSYELIEDSPFDKTAPPFAEAARSYDDDVREEQATGDIEPMAYAHEESPFEDPIDGYSADALAVEAPSGVHVSDAPLAAEVPTDLADEFIAASESSVDAGEDETAAIPADAAATVTMADLYVRQGLIDDARQIYENILARDPENAAVREKLAAISTGENSKIDKLQNWLSKMTRKEVGSV